MDGTPQKRITEYLRLSGLERLVGREAEVERAIRDLMDALAEKVAIGDADSLYTYPVPMLSEDGTCTIVDEMAPVPYDLTAILGGRSEQSEQHDDEKHAAHRACLGREAPDRKGDPSIEGCSMASSSPLLPPTRTPPCRA